MPLTDEQIEYLAPLKNEGFCHASNILAKRNDSKIGFFFDPYKTFSEALCGTLTEAVAALNTYKDFVARHSKYKFQSKFAPTIIEEFVCRILKNEFGNDVLMYGSVSAYSSLYFSYSGKKSFKQGIDLRLNVKEQDVGIYKKETLTSDSGDKHDIFIPIVCIECKTYLDKTMYEGSVATADKIKSGNPHCLFLLVTETYGVSQNVDIELSNIDNIYVLRKQRTRKNQTPKPIFYEVVKHLVETIRKQLESNRLPVDERIEQYGYLRF